MEENDDSLAPTDEDLRERIDILTAQIIAITGRAKGKKELCRHG